MCSCRPFWRFSILRKRVRVFEKLENRFWYHSIPFLRLRRHGNPLDFRGLLHKSKKCLQKPFRIPNRLFNVMGFLKYFYGFRNTNQVFNNGTRLSEDTLRQSNLIFSKIEGFLRHWKPRRYFQKRFHVPETLPKTFKGFQKGFRLSSRFLENGFLLEGSAH